MQQTLSRFCWTTAHIKAADTILLTFGRSHRVESQCFLKSTMFPKIILTCVLANSGGKKICTGKNVILTLHIINIWMFVFEYLKVQLHSAHALFMTKSTRSIISQSNILWLKELLWQLQMKWANSNQVFITALVVIYSKYKRTTSRDAWYISDIVLLHYHELNFSKLSWAHWLQPLFWHLCYFG